MPYVIAYSPEAVEHLMALSKSQQVLVLDQVDEQLTDQATLPTRRRKFLRPNAIPPWELRLGNIRVFYDVEEAVATPSESRPATVVVKAVGIKEHNKLRIGGVEIQL